MGCRRICVGSAGDFPFCSRRVSQTCRKGAVTIAGHWEKALMGACGVGVSAQCAVRRCAPTEVDPDRETAGAAFLRCSPADFSTGCDRARRDADDIASTFPLVNINPVVGVVLRRPDAACDSPGSGAGAPGYKGRGQEPMPALASATLE